MTPYMAELVNIELSPGRAFPGAEKLPKFLLSPALPCGLRSLSVREKQHEKSRKFFMVQKWCPGFWWSIWPPHVQQLSSSGSSLVLQKPAGLGSHTFTLSRVGLDSWCNEPDTARASGTGSRLLQ